MSNKLGQGVVLVIGYPMFTRCILINTSDQAWRAVKWQITNDQVKVRDTTLDVDALEGVCVVCKGPTGRGTAYTQNRRICST